MNLKQFDAISDLRVGSEMRRRAMRFLINNKRRFASQSIGTYRKRKARDEDEDENLGRGEREWRENRI